MNINLSNSKLKGIIEYGDDHSPVFYIKIGNIEYWTIFTNTWHYTHAITECDKRGNDAWPVRSDWHWWTGASEVISKETFDGGAIIQYRFLKSRTGHYQEILKKINKL